MAFYMGPGLSHGAMKTILKKATEELKDKYLPNMTSGEWMGTMCLTNHNVERSWFNKINCSS